MGSSKGFMRGCWNEVAHLVLFTDSQAPLSVIQRWLASIEHRVDPAAQPVTDRPLLRAASPAPVPATRVRRMDHQVILGSVPGCHT